MEFIFTNKDGNRLELAHYNNVDDATEKAKKLANQTGQEITVFQSINLIQPDEDIKLRKEIDKKTTIDALDKIQASGKIDEHSLIYIKAAQAHLRDFLDVVDQMGWEE